MSLPVGHELSQIANLAPLLYVITTTYYQQLLRVVLSDKMHAYRIKLSSADPPLPRASPAPHKH